MISRYLVGAGSIALALAPGSALAASMGYELRLAVPVYCTVQHEGAGSGIQSRGSVALGKFREYCNSPRGYELIITYAPGALKGTRIIAGEEEVILDGSGRSVLSRASGPRVRERVIVAVPGQNGFDTDRLELAVIPA